MRVAVFILKPSPGPHACKLAPPMETSQRDEQFYRSMVRMRAVETELLALSSAGQLRGSLHLAQGQEALPAGAGAALRKDDYVTATYRGHGYVLAKGGPLLPIIAEILGKAAGLGGGKGGKMHLFDLEHGILGTNGIVGAAVGTAAGAAWAAQLQKSDRVALTVCGDGALNQGHVSECMNMAVLYQLPLIILCENNLYSEMTPLSRSHGDVNLAGRAAGFGLNTAQVDGNDPEAVYQVMSEAVNRARTGGGPTFIEAATYRTIGHYQADSGIGYRTAEEVEAWRAKSPLDRWAAKLGKRAPAIAAEEQAVVRAVFEEVLALPGPDPLAAGTQVFA